MITILDVNVIEADLPTTISAYVVANSDGTHTIILNARLTWERKRQAYIHELNHIKNGDYERQSADKIEMFAHKQNTRSVS